MKNAAEEGTVVVPASWFEAGYFPRLCVKSGQPCGESLLKVKATRENPFALVGLLLGLIPYVILAAILRKQIDGSVPFASHQQLKSRNRKIGGVILLTSILSFGTFYTGVPALYTLGYIGLAGLIIGPGFIFITPGTGAKFKLSKDKQMVTLKTVHPDFAAATEALLFHTMNPQPGQAIHQAAYEQPAPQAMNQPSYSYEQATTPDLPQVPAPAREPYQVA